MTPTINATVGSITATGNVGNVNSYNTIYCWYPEEKRAELANWISDLDFSQYQSQAFERYTEGTLLWVLEEPEFIAWKTDEGMLWCPGEPGAGKTIFASFIINYLQNLSLNPNAAVCYIYCRYYTSPSTLQLFEAILRQLILCCPSMDIKRVQAAKNRGKRLTLKEILSTLQETSDHIANIFIVLDAFDECFDEATRHQVLRHLQDLTSVKTLITSRPLPSIQGTMGTARKLIISAQVQDIKTHFRAQKNINPALAKLVSRVSDTDIEGKLVEKAHGRFLLAGLHITNLAAQTSVNQLLRALETLPSEVTASYQETLDRIRVQDPNRRRLAFHTLSWIFYALRPLKLTELRHALAIHDLERMAEEDDLTDEEDIVSLCAGLVVVNRWKTFWGTKEIVRVDFLHYTVQEFLQQARTGPDFLSEIEIALQCMKVISFPGITSNPPNYPFIKYAASAWGPLVRRHEQDNLVFEFALSQLTDPVTVKVLSDMEINDELKSYSGSYWNRCGATAMHLIAVYGLNRTLKAFLTRTSAASINEKDRRGHTALIWAARNGNVEVVKELLAHSNVDVNSEDKHGRTSLSWAAQKEDLEVVKELLIRSDVDSKDKSGRTPFSWAAGKGNVEVIKELLACSDVDVDSSDECGRTPLSWAAGKGKLEVVKELLVRSDVNADSKDRSGRTPLSRAAQVGGLEVVKEFLSRSDVDVDSKDESARTPLSWAAGNRSVEVVKELLARSDVDADSKDESGRTPLSWAASSWATRGRNMEVVKELLARSDVNVNSNDKSGRTPLSWAAEEGNVEVIKELLARSDVDADSNDERGRTPLSWAAGKEKLEAVKELLTRSDVDVNSKDKVGRTPLSWAVGNQSVEVVKELLARSDVDVNPRDESGRTPLSWATRDGNVEVVEELLACPDIDVNSKDESGRTPLSWAAENGHLEVIKLLVNTPHVDINSKDTWGLTVVLWAAHRGHLSVVNFLLDISKISLPGNRSVCPVPPVPSTSPLPSPEDLLSLQTFSHSEAPSSQADVLLQDSQPYRQRLSEPILSSATTDLSRIYTIDWLD